MVGPTAANTAAKYFVAHRWLFQLSLTPPEIAAAKTRAIVILTPGHVDCFYSSINFIHLLGPATTKHRHGCAHCFVIR